MRGLASHRLGALVGFPAVAVLVLGSAGAYFAFFHIPDRRAEAIESWRQRLEVAADQRRLALELWVGDGIAAVEGVASYPPVRALVSPPAKRPGARTLGVAHVEDALTHLVSERGHRGTLVVDASTRVVARSERLEVLAPAYLEAAKAAMATGAPVCAFEARQGGEAVVTFAAPIHAATGDSQEVAPQGAVVVSADPSEWLYPFITTPPIPAKTAESLLVRRDGGDVLFLSPLRHNPAEPLTLRRRLAIPGLAAQAAVAGRQVFGAFDDYRGVRVLAATRRIRATDWGFVTKVDLDEALVPFHRRMWGEALGLGSLLIAVLGLALVAMRADRLGREAALARAHGRLGLLLDQANDAILFLSPEGRIVEANDRAGGFYGCSMERLIGTDVRDLRPEEMRTDVDRQLSQCRREGSAVFATLHRRLDGPTFPVEVTLRMASADEGHGFIEVTRDISERKRAEERFRIVAETMNDLLYEWDLGERVEWFGDIDRMLGYDQGEYPRTATGHTATIHPGDLERVMAAIDRHLRGEALYEVEYRVQRKDGSYAHWFARGATVRGSDGEPSRWVGAVTDITERKRAEEALAASELRYRRLFESARDGILILDAETGMIVDVNPFMVELLGLSREAFLGKAIWEVGFLKDIAANKANFVELREKNHIQYEDLPLETVDGRRIDVEFVGNAYQVKQHRVMQCNIRDITERKRAEAELRLQTLLLTTQQEASPDGILVVDGDAQIVSFNQRFVEMWGIPTEVVEQKCDGPLLRFNTDQVADPGSFLGRVQYLSEHPRETSRDEVSLKDGRTFDRYSAPMFGSDDRYYGRVWYFRDITDRKQGESALRQAQEALFQSQKIEAVGLLAGGIAHDFNNILGVILGYGQMLERSLDADHPGYARLAQILSAARRAADLTHQLLAFSRKQVLQLAVVDLSALVREVETMLLRLIEEDVSLVTRLDPQLGATRADPGQLSQILVNLAVNARDAMPEGGTLTIETANVDVDETYAFTHPPTTPGPYVSLSVSDTGTGMDEATRQRIFEPFFTTKALGEGTGLGLSTVYGIVKQSEGYIWVYSEPGIGTTFKILLPRISDVVAPSGAAPVELRLETSDTEGATVLVVEDQDSMRQMIGEILEEEGYRVLAAADGDDALRLAARHEGPIDVLLTDVIMPGMTGRMLAERLSTLRPGLRVLYMSGYTRDVVSRRGILEDNVLLLEKPFTAAGLLKRIRDARSRMPRP